MSDIADSYPDPGEIKPYVAFGPSPEYSITVHKKTFDTAFIAFTIIFGSAIIIIVILTIIFAYNQSKITVPTVQKTTLTTSPVLLSNQDSLTSNQDSLAFSNKHQCLMYINTKWVDDHCECKEHFFGPMCTRERHNNKYFPVGIPDENNLEITVIDEVFSDGKSFNNSNTDSCSDYCNKTKNCNGFIYHSPGMCTLLTENVIVPIGDNISYSDDIDATLYMKSSDNLIFDGRIFLAAYMSTFPSRYWLIKESEGYMQLVPGNITKLLFYPEYAKIHGAYTGIYCLNPFTIHDIQDILSHNDSMRSSQIYIHHPGHFLNIPLDWKYKTPLYVVYV